MAKQSIALKSVKFVFKDLLFDLVYWLVWWYKQGTKKAFINMQKTISQGNQELGLTIWLKNIFKPMFGQYDWQGRIISFFMRVFQIIIRFIIFLFWVVFALVVFCLWLIAPIFLIFQIIYNLGFFEIINL